MTFFSKHFQLPKRESMVAFNKITLCTAVTLDSRVEVDFFFDSFAEIDTTGEAIEHGSKPFKIHSFKKLSCQLSALIHEKLARRIDQIAQMGSIGITTHRALCYLNDELILQLISEGSHIICHQTLLHLNQVLVDRPTRARLIKKLLDEIREFLNTLTIINQKIATSGLKDPTERQILNFMSEIGYFHCAISPNSSSGLAHLKARADDLFNTLWPKCEKEMDRSKSDLVAIANHLLCRSFFKPHFEKGLKALCLQGIKELADQLAHRQLWTNSLNDGLARFKDQLQAHHDGKLQFPPLMSVGPKAVKGDLLLQELAQKGAQTSSAFFRFIPLFHKLQGFCDRIFHPAMAVGQRWSEQLITQSTISSLHHFLDTPMHEWFSCAIKQLEILLRAGKKEGFCPQTIKPQVLATVRKIMLRVIFYPIYTLNAFASHFAALPDKFIALIDQLSATFRALRPLYTLGLLLRNLANAVIRYFWHFKLILGARYVAVTLWHRAINCLISPIAFVVANQVDERFIELSKSPVKQVFVHRILDILMQELQLNTPPTLQTSRT